MQRNYKTSGLRTWCTRLRLGVFSYKRDRYLLTMPEDRDWTPLGAMAPTPINHLMGQPPPHKDMEILSFGSMQLRCGLTTQKMNFLPIFPR